MSRLVRRSGVVCHIVFPGVMAFHNSWTRMRSEYWPDVRAGYDLSQALFQFLFSDVVIVGPGRFA